MRRAYYLVFIVVLFCCCNRPVDKQKLASYLNDTDNGVKKEVEIGPYKIKLTYRPIDLLLEQEMAGVTDPVKISKKRKQYEDYHYFILNMSLGDKDVLYKGSSSQEQFSTSLNKLNFGLSDYVYALADKSDTLYLADYYVPNLYGMGGSTQIMLAFPRGDKKGYKELEIYLKELGFGTGSQRFVFQMKDIEAIPLLKLSAQQVEELQLLTQSL